MYSAYLTPFSWIVFWLLTVAVLTYDQKRCRAEAEARGLGDFVDRSLKSYFLLALFLGGLVLVVYFWATRKSAKGGLIGAGMLCALMAVTAIVGGGFSVVANVLDHSAVVSACSSQSPSDPDGDDCAFGSSQFPQEKQQLLTAGCQAGLLTPCLWLDDGPRIGSYEVPESEAHKRAQEICANRPASAPRGRCPTPSTTQ